jgi:hypothetical protein
MCQLFSSVARGRNAPIAVLGWVVYGYFDERANLGIRSH